MTDIEVLRHDTHLDHVEMVVAEGLADLADATVSEAELDGAVDALNDRLKDGDVPLEVRHTVDSDEEEPFDERVFTRHSILDAFSDRGSVQARRAVVRGLRTRIHQLRDGTIIPDNATDSKDL